MQDKCNQCFKCAKFRRYYITGKKDFEMTKFGWCRKNLKNVQSTESCSEYQLKPRFKKVDLSIQCQLNRLLTEISMLRMIIEEEINEDK